jgi:hypothetical protein
MTMYKYIDADKHEDNFNRWWKASSLEREMHNQELYTEKRARKIFKDQWGYKEIKKNIFG